MDRLDYLVIFEHTGADGEIGLSFESFDTRDAAYGLASRNNGVVEDAAGNILRDYRDL